LGVVLAVGVLAVTRCPARWGMGERNGPAAAALPAGRAPASTETSHGW